jgi:2,4-dichlorophenol 6-monooxygenase
VDGQDLRDVDGQWAEVCQIEPTGALLVRPDQHIAYRSVSAVADPEEALRDVVRTVLGQTATASV